MVRWGRRCQWSGLGLLGYVTVGYPALMIGLGRCLPERRRGPATLPPVSVVVAAHNEQRAIGAKLTSLASSDYPSDLVQVLVSDDGSTDGTLHAARSADTGAEVITGPRRQGKAVALNRGVARARHPIVVFSDAENLLAPHALTALVEPFSDPDVGAVTGRVLLRGGDEQVSGGDRWYWRYEHEVRRGEARAGSVTGVSGALLAVRRELVGTLPPGLVNDDFYLAMRVARQGRRVDYAPEAVTTELSASSMRDEQVRRRRISAGRWQSLVYGRSLLPWRRPVVLWQVLSHKYLRLLLPLAVVAGPAGGLAQVAGRWIQGHRAGRPEAGLAVQGLVLLAAWSAPRLPRRPRGLRLLAMALRYALVSSATAATGLRQALRPQGPLHLWQRVVKEDG